MNDNLISSTISFLRFPLMVGIVFIHFNILNGVTVQGVVYGADIPVWHQFIINLCSDVIPRIAVPMFFFISGYLFFLKDSDNHKCKEKLKRRFNTLFIPYILWNLIAIGILLLKTSSILDFLFINSENISHADYSLKNVLALFWNKDMFFSSQSVPAQLFPLDVPLWYLRELMIVMLLSPLLFESVKIFGGYSVAVAGCVWLLFSIMPIPNAYISVNQLSTGIFFFLWGSLYSISKIDFLVIFRKWRGLLFFYIPIAVIDACTKGSPVNIMIHNGGIFIGVISMFALASYIIEKREMNVICALGNDVSFFIFALHYLIMQDIGKAILKVLLYVFSSLPAWSYVLFYFFVPCMTIVLQLILYKFLRKYFSVALSVLTGNR